MNSNIVQSVIVLFDLSTNEQSVYSPVQFIFTALLKVTCRLLLDLRGAEVDERNSSSVAFNLSPKPTSVTTPPSLAMPFTKRMS